MEIKVLGPGCQNCVTLNRIVLETVSALGIDAVVTKVEDYPTIASYGVLSTPGLVINERLVMSGRVPTPEQVRALISAENDLLQ